MPEPDTTRADALRKQHRTARANLPSSVQTANATALAARIAGIAVFDAAQTVAAYIAIRGEIDLGPLLDHASTRGKSVFLPVLRGESMVFAAWTPGEPLVKRGMGLLEPEHADTAQIAATDLDIVLAPLVVFDTHCQRIGQGGGFYDRTFAFRKSNASRSPVLVGVAHDSQREDKLSPMPWDVPLDMIATDKALYLREETGKS